ncbi:uncharacterized protein KZ484_025597 isoform 2-T2 [Pholidichthys leucotaenia]
MASAPVRRKTCLLRLKENCPIRKLCRRTYDISAGAKPSSSGPDWNPPNPTDGSNQPISTISSEPLPHSSRCSLNQSQADAHMEEEPPTAESHQNPENQAEDRMELDNDVDPETGERAQG